MPMSPSFKLTVYGALLGACVSSAAWANPPPARPRVLRDRFRGTVLVGATVGVGSPMGFGGGFVELRPWRAFGISVGGGVGGAFGPALAVSTLFAPIGGRLWALGVEGAFSRQFSYGRDLATPDGRTMPAGSNWLSAGVAIEVRPSRNLMLRVGVGRSWLLNTADFGVFRPDEIAWVAQNYTAPPGASPLDAARAAHGDDTLGVWYCHLDVAPAWRW
jgi:hypothetical protein